MTTEINLRPILDRKQWEMCNYSPVITTIGSFVVSSNLQDQYQYFFTSAIAMTIYDPINDAWMSGPSPALAGTFGAGSCGTRHPWGPRSFPTGGTTTTIPTSLNLQRGLNGYVIRIVAGPNAGVEAVIASNTTGPNSVITVATPFGTAITTASEFILLTGRVWVINAGTVAAGSFKYYDVALNTWNNANQTGLPATITIDAKLVATPGYLEDFAVGVATSATSTTLVKSTANWGTNTWTNYQVRIASGTGAGQTRTIASNTSTTLTVSAAWTITPDATSNFEIEGNSDYLYFLGNNAVTMYRYSVSGNTWTTLAPTVARAGAPVAGMSANWVWNVTDPSWNIESNFLNGQYIYSFRGTTAILDRYNICTNAWESDIAYSPKVELFATGTSWSYIGNFIYGMIPSTGRLLKYNIAENRMEPASQLWYTQGVTHIGDRLFDASYTDGATKLTWIYYITASQNTLFRMLLF
jgi:hypothetical protein